MLAGDHLKTASDLGLPLVGVGLAFSQGYFRQSLDDEGWQTERYPPNDWHDLPVLAVDDADGKRVTVAVTLPGSAQAAQGARRGRSRRGASTSAACRSTCSTRTSRENAPEDRALTEHALRRRPELRIRQEIMLGIGGVHALAAVGAARRRSAT